MRCRAPRRARDSPAPEPGTAARAYLGLKATPSRIAVFNATYGLNESLPRQFVSYVSNVLHGNFGISYFYTEPVSSLRIACEEPPSSGR